jgi:MSHA biogenesis protein MshN
MSVINRMLQELEARHEAPTVAAGFVRAVPPASRPRRAWLWTALAGVFVIALGAGVWLWRSPPVTGAVRGSPVKPPVVRPAPEPTLNLSRDLAAPAAAKPAAPEMEQAFRPVPQAQSRQPLARAEPVGVTQGTQSSPITPAPAEQAGGDAAGRVLKQVTPRQRAEQRYQEGVALLAQGQREAARARFLEALAIEPRDWTTREALVALLITEKSLTEAERVLREGLTLAPAARPAMALARIELERGAVAEALQTLASHSAAAQRDADYQAFHAAVLARAGRPAEAAERYRAALALDPGRATAWLGLGLALDALGRRAEAAQALARADSLPGLSAEIRAFIRERVRELSGEAGAP